MRRTKSRANRVVLCAATASIGLVFGWSPQHAVAANTATQQYFDNNGSVAGFGLTTNTTYSWDSADWGTSSLGTSATAAYHQDPLYSSTSFARFNATTAGDTYTLNVGTTEYSAGMFVDSLGTATLTLNVNQRLARAATLTFPARQMLQMDF